MYIFVRCGDGTIHELYGAFNRIDCLGREIVNFLHAEKKSNMYKVLFAVAKCEIPAPDEFEYLAWVYGTSVSIHCARKEDTYNSEKQQEAIFITRFNWNISSSEVEEFIRRDAFRTWLELGEISLKGISSLTKSLWA